MFLASETALLLAAMLNTLEYVNSQPVLKYY